MPEHLTKADFQAKVFDFEQHKDWQYAGDLPCIVDFYADWCGPCQVLAPVLEELGNEYAGELHVYKVNTEEEPQLAQLFGIRSIPSLLFVPTEGQPQMVTGALPKGSLKQIIGEVLGLES